MRIPVVAAITICVAAGTAVLPPSPDRPKMVRRRSAGGSLERFQAEGPRRKTPRNADPVESGAESTASDAGSAAAIIAEIAARVHEWAQLESAVDRAIQVMFSDVPSEFDGRPLKSVFADSVSHALGPGWEGRAAKAISETVDWYIVDYACGNQNILPRMEKLRLALLDISSFNTATVKMRKSTSSLEFSNQLVHANTYLQKASERLREVITGDWQGPIFF